MINLRSTIWCRDCNSNAKRPKKQQECIFRKQMLIDYAIIDDILWIAYSIVSTTSRKPPKGAPMRPSWWQGELPKKVGAKMFIFGLVQLDDAAFGVVCTTRTVLTCTYSVKDDLAREKLSRAWMENPSPVSRSDVKRINAARRENKNVQPSSTSEG